MQELIRNLPDNVGLLIKEAVADRENTTEEISAGIKFLLKSLPEENFKVFDETVYAITGLHFENLLETGGDNYGGY